MHRIKHRLLYCLIRFGTYPLSFLSYKTLHRLGKILGETAYHLIPEFRNETKIPFQMGIGLFFHNTVIRKNPQALAAACQTLSEPRKPAFCDLAIKSHENFRVRFSRLRIN